VTRLLVLIVAVLAFGAARLPLEHGLLEQHRALHFQGVDFNLGLREGLGQTAFIAALSGFRSVIADGLFIKAQVAWENTEWGRVLLLFRQATTLEPRSVLFWDMAAWHMGWNASAAALNDPTIPRRALREKAAREYYDIGKDFLERGIRYNPDKPQLYESLARLYQQKYNDHLHASQMYAKAAQLPNAPSYDKRFAAYELSYCEGHEKEAYAVLRRLYDMGDRERLPTLLARLKALEGKLGVPAQQRIPLEAHP
jgi:tetratricopeptide (TPR) repeat protein